MNILIIVVVVVVVLALLGFGAVGADRDAV